MSASEEGPVSGGFTAAEELLHEEGFAAIQEGLAAGLGFEQACAAIKAGDADLCRIIADDYLKVTIARRHFQGGASRISLHPRHPGQRRRRAPGDARSRGGSASTPPSGGCSGRVIQKIWRRQIALFVGGMIAGCYFLVDRPAVIWARDLDPQLIAVFEKITAAGSATPYLIALAVLYPVLRFSLRRAAAAKRALFVIAAIVVSGLSVDLLKPLSPAGVRKHFWPIRRSTGSRSSRQPAYTTRSRRVTLQPRWRWPARWHCSFHACACCGSSPPQWWRRAG
jgi:hypothetical protein